MEARLRKLTKELRVADRTIFSGAVFEDEKWAAYRDADVFVLPSQNENFGNTAAEAAAVGTPVIVTENCGVAPLLADGGRVIAHEEEALRKALGELLQNEPMRERLGRSAMAAAGTIGWEGPVQEAEALYRKLAENSKGKKIALCGVSVGQRKTYCVQARLEGGECVPCGLPAGMVYSAGWEYSVRQYLNGFSDAIVPVPATPEQKVDAILNWMRSGPPRAVAANPDACRKGIPKRR